MSNPVIAPTGRGHSLMIREKGLMVAANPHLIFAATDDLYSLKTRVLAYPPGPQFKFYLGYRLTEAFRTADIYGPGTNEAVAAFKTARRDRDTALDVIADKIVATGDVEHISEAFNETAADQVLLNPPEVPLTKESRILPPGSLLLRSLSEEGKWFSLTPEEYKNEGLFRADSKRPHKSGAIVDPAGCKIVPTNVDLATQMRRVRPWLEDHTRHAHRQDIKTLQEIAQPVYWKRVLGL